MRQPLQVLPSMNRWLNLADRLDPVDLDADQADDFTRSDKVTGHRVRVRPLVYLRSHKTISTITASPDGQWLSFHRSKPTNKSMKLSGN